MHKLNPPRAFVLAAIVLATCSFAFGQETTGSIEGTVKDSAGALVPNVTLTITNARATASGTTTTGIGLASNGQSRQMTKALSVSCRFRRAHMMW